jgi:glutamine---fructose-6-phosphate transaminase (isomerizing)
MIRPADRLAPQVPPPTDPEAIRGILERTTAWKEASSADKAIAQALRVARELPSEQLEPLAKAERLVIAGAGSSYYVAQIAAAALRLTCRLPAVAAPLSELMLRPEGVLADAAPERQPVVVVSRSGTTTEAVSVVRQTRLSGHPTLAITCRPDSEMARLAHASLAIPDGDERAIVMTRSFAALTTALLRITATLSDDSRLTNDLDALPAAWADTAAPVDRAIELAAGGPSRVVVLGGGAALGLANEAVLKLTETGQVPASAFEPLEFRHGPISVCEPGMLVVGLLGGTSTEAEGRVLEESAALGASTWALGPEGPGAALHEIARLPLVLHPLQALALGLALRRGRDPEAPRHLSQVVVLGDG